MPMLNTQGLTGHYGDFQALFGLDITVGKNESVSLIGANGAGKTTTMRAIAGLLSSPAHMIQWKEQSIGNLRADQVAKLGIAMVPEGRQLFPSLSVEENLKIGAQSARSGPWKLNSVYELFPMLTEHRHKPSTSLSGGQQQMVAIGRALMSNPEIILFDEISLGLAPIVIKQIYTALPEIVRDGTSALIVEQDIKKALQYTDRFYCLSEGRVTLNGDSANADQHDIVQAYFGN